MDEKGTVVHFPVSGIAHRTTSATTARSAALTESYLRWCEVRRGRSPATLRSYRGLLQTWIKWISSDVLDVTRAEMEFFLGRPRRSGRRASANTIYREAATLRAFYKWMHDEHYTQVDLAAGLATPRRPARNPRPIDDAIWRQLWAHDWSPRVRVVLALGYFLGLRRAELWNLRVEQLTEDSIVDFVRKGGGEQTLKITNYTAVYENTPLLQPLLLSTDLVMTALAQVRREAPTWLVPGREGAQHPESLNKSFTRWCSHARTDPLTPHQLRHSAATNLARAGVPAHLIMAMLNHGSIDVTMRYIRASGAEVEEWITSRYGD